MQSVTPVTSKLDFTEDPFRDYRYEDPFNIADPFDDVAPIPAPPPSSTSKLDPFGMEILDKTSEKSAPVNVKVTSNLDSWSPTPINGKTTPLNGKSTPSPLPSEDQQLAWAAAESLRLEEERRLQENKEKAELELAMALSKKEKKRGGPFSKILSLQSKT